ncbi:MAG TPA: hemolysin family protein [Lentimicrobium sp.]|jgi:CBS domain containing-hemolysin-like protein|nr:hemolysin family protein [Lentimicrobium sp.]
MQPLYPAIIALIISAFFTGIETAFLNANKLKIEVDKGRDLFSAKLLSRIIKNPSIFTGTIWTGGIISLVVYAIYGDKYFATIVVNYITPQYAANTLVLLIEIFILSLIYILFGEFLSRLLFRINPNGLLKFFALPLFIIYISLYPIVGFFNYTGTFVLKSIFRVNIKPTDYSFSTSDLNNLLSETSIEPLKENEEYQELQMIMNARDLNNIKLREFMVPRNEIVAIEKTDTIETMGNLIVESGHSKILVYDETVDNIIGYVHSYDIFGKPAKLNDIIRPVIYVPGTMAADRLLNRFIVERKSVAVIVDEFGGTAGMLTIEDILEEIFGDIEDEYDTDEIEDSQISENEFLVSGRDEIYYLNEKYNLGLTESDDYQTLAGYIIFYHESIPSQDEEIIIGNHSFLIREASETRIEKVLIRKITD